MENSMGPVNTGGGPTKPRNEVSAPRGVESARKEVMVGPPLAFPPENGARGHTNFFQTSLPDSLQIV